MKKRTISVLIMAAIIIPLLIIGGVPYMIGVGLLSLVAFLEIISLKEPEQKKLPLFIVAITLLAFLLIVYSNIDGTSILFGLDYSKLALSSLLIMIPTIFISKEQYPINRALRNLGMIIFIGLGFNLLINIFNYNKGIFLYLLGLTIFTDTFAYLSGSLIGKYKFFPNISPKKSWEGFIIGTIMGTFLAIVVYINFIGNPVNMTRLIVITYLLSVIGQLGDLFFSLIKREHNIKDFSNLIPGHGGVLDRLDSVIFVLISYLIFRLYI